MKLRALNYSELNDGYLEILGRKHKDAVGCIIQNCGSDYYNSKTVNEILWRFDLEVLEDLIVFFALQELYEFAEYIEKAIQVKTLHAVHQILKI